MKRLSTTLVIWALLLVTAAAQQVTFRFSDGIEDMSLKQRMQEQISQLLTEINRAAAAERPLQLDAVKMTPQARKSLESLWNGTSSFRCEYTENARPCLRDVSGYEVRGIAVTMLNRQLRGDRLREVCINLSADGTITSVHMALKNNMYLDLLANSRDVTDMRRKLEIMNFVDKFRSYYDEKDLDALQQIYSDDALIITGRVITRKTYVGDKPTIRKEVAYRRQNKEEYLNNLKDVFAKNTYIHLTFDDVKIYGHKSKANWYGVSLRQNWRSTNSRTWSNVNYEDDGYLFLLWEFPDGDDAPPVVHVRTWQPEWVDKQRLSSDSVFNINDFLIP